MKRFRLEFCYKGTNYCGWQSQPDGSAIQDHVEKVLKVLLREDIRILAASRTDSGVHAEHQVACFQYDKEFETQKILKGLNSLLPRDIRCSSIGEVDWKFHPILNARAKVYRYRIARLPFEHPFYGDFVWTQNYSFNLALMQEAASKIKGLHDFTAFCATDSTAKTKTREIYDLQIKNHGHVTDFWFLGNGFLKQMVRSLVGTLATVGKEKLSPDEFFELLQNKKRVHAIKTAPAQGLTLMKIFYEKPQLNLDQLGFSCSTMD